MQKVKPICIYLTEEQRWIDRKERAVKYFEEQGIEDVMWVRGIHAVNSGLLCSKIYERDEQNKLSGASILPKTLGCNLSVYSMYAVMNTHPKVDWFFVLECDVEFVDGWKERLDEVIREVPDDADMIYVGWCCSSVEQVISEKVSKGRCLCGHAYFVRQKSVQKIINRLGDLSLPIDVELFDNVMPYLNVYMITPRLATQLNTNLPL
jgi:hypothetical protein